MVGFEKILYLPSGGLYYSPLVRSRPITHELNILQSDAHYYSSLFEYYLTIIDHYCKLPVPLTEMYNQDLYYIWFFYMVTDLIRSGNYYLNTLCSKCYEKNMIMVNLGDLDINIVNPYSTKLEVNPKYDVDDGRYTIYFRRRRAQDNIEFGNLLLNSEFEEGDQGSNDILVIILFLSTQIDKIVFQSTGEIEKKYYYAVLSSLLYRDLIRLLEFTLKIENEIGINNNLFFDCKHCHKPQAILLFDNIMLSKIGAPDTKNIIQKQEDFFEQAFGISRLPILSYNEYLQLPIRYAPAISNVLMGMKFAPII